MPYHGDAADSGGLLRWLLTAPEKQLDCWHAEGDSIRAAVIGRSLKIRQLISFGFGRHAIVTGTEELAITFGSDAA